MHYIQDFGRRHHLPLLVSRSLLFAIGKVVHETRRVDEAKCMYGEKKSQGLTWLWALIGTKARMRVKRRALKRRPFQGRDRSLSPLVFSKGMALRVLKKQSRLTYDSSFCTAERKALSIHDLKVKSRYSVLCYVIPTRP